jgi:hypothetical protein
MHAIHVAICCMQLIHVILRVNLHVCIIVICNKIYISLQAKNELLKQDHVAPRLKSLQQLYGRHHDLVDSYEITISQMTMTCFPFYADVVFHLSPIGLLPHDREISDTRG